MANYLLDSDVLIWLLRGRKETIDLVDELSDEVTPACSALSRYEVEVGMQPKEKKVTAQLFRDLTVIPVDGLVAHQAAAFVQMYKAKGKALDPFDALIASTGVIHDLVLVTYNQKHFPMPELRKYPV